jgi:predicted oxidoreductase
VRKGRVAGVTVAKDGKEFRVNARCVIIATGGYARNKELLKKYYPLIMRILNSSDHLSWERSYSWPLK